MTAVLEAHGFGKRYRRRTWALRGAKVRGGPDASPAAANASLPSGSRS